MNQDTTYGFSIPLGLMLVSLSGHEIPSLASGSVYEDLGQKWDLSLSVI